MGLCLCFVYASIFMTCEVAQWYIQCGEEDVMWSAICYSDSSL